LASLACFGSLDSEKGEIKYKQTPLECMRCVAQVQCGDSQSVINSINTFPFFEIYGMVQMYHANNAELNFKGSC
jgi:hypothetical protein